MSTNLFRYEQFGWDYERLNPIGERELSWYRRFAAEVGGPILELACGTGRLLTKIAEAGYQIDGVDLATTMLKLAERRIELLPPEIRSRIQLFNRDMTNLETGSTYNLIILADNSFRELQNRTSQRSCLKSVVACLSQYGKILITVRRFELTSYKDGKMSVPWSNPTRHPISGLMVRRKVEFHLSEDRTSESIVYFYKTVDANNQEIIEECQFQRPVMETSDYQSLFDAVGLTAEIYIDYSNKPDDGLDPVICFVCSRKV